MEPSANPSLIWGPKLFGLPANVWQSVKMYQNIFQPAMKLKLVKYEECCFLLWTRELIALQLK